MSAPTGAARVRSSGGGCGEPPPDGERVWLEAAVLRGGHSPRLGGLDTAHVRELARLAHPLRPLVVQRGSLRVVDGMHRLAAARVRGEQRVCAVYFDGTDDEAFLAAVRLNGVHGRPLARHERQAAAARVLASHPAHSDRWIAAACGVAPRTVAALRRTGAGGARPNTRIGLDGRARPLSAEGGRRLAAEILTEQPGTSLREVARRADISLGTASDVRRRLAAADAARTAPGDAEVPAARDRLDALLRDPSLQHSERGREVLRLARATIGLLDLAGGGPPGAEPAPCRESLRAVALVCAEGWYAFGERLAAEQV